MMSWLRSTLALIVGITVTMHQAAPDFGVVPTSLLGLVGTALSVISYSTAYSRFVRSDRRIRRTLRTSPPSAIPLFFLTLATVVGGACAILFATRILQG